MREEAIVVYQASDEVSEGIRCEILHLFDFFHMYKLRFVWPLIDVGWGRTLCSIEISRYFKLEGYYRSSYLVKEKMFFGQETVHILVYCKIFWSLFILGDPNVLLKVLV